MGRHYTGQISGKFWLGIQSSSDASEFGVDYNGIIRYHVCQCDCEYNFEKGPETNDDDDEISKLYCSDCYSSYEEHMQAIEEEGLELDVDESKNTWFISSSEIEYKFDKSHIEIIEDKIKTLEREVGQYMESYKIIDDENENEITYDYDLPDNIKNSINELPMIARLCFGKQILYCLQKYDTCCFYAET